MFGREEMRAYIKARRADWSARGLCPYCGRERDSKYKVCNRCRELARARQSRYEAKRKKR